MAYLSGDTIIATVVDSGRNSRPDANDVLTAALRVKGDNYYSGSDLFLDLNEDGVNSGTFLATIRTGTTTAGGASASIRSNIGIVKAVQGGTATVAYTGDGSIGSLVKTLSFTSFDATLAFDVDAYPIGAYAVITHADAEENTDFGRVETLLNHATIETSSFNKALVGLVETGVDTGTFRGSLLISDTSTLDYVRIQASAGETLTVSCTDEINTSGFPRTVSAKSRIIAFTTPTPPGTATPAVTPTVTATPKMTPAPSGTAPIPKITPTPTLATWTGRESGIAKRLKVVAYGKSLFVAVGEEGTIVTSPDGEAWTARESGITERLKGVAYGASTFVAVGEMGAIATSPDGVKWTKRESGIRNWINGVCYGNAMFVAVCDQGTVLTSSNGVEWKTRKLKVSNRLIGVSYGNSTFVVAGEGGIMVTSAKGKKWAVGDSGVESVLCGMAYGGVFFVAVGDGGVVLTSEDGQEWSAVDSGVTNRLNGIAYGDSAFVAVGNNGTILHSSDGVAWRVSASGVTSNFNGVAFGTSSFVIVGDEGTILQGLR